MGFEFSVWTRRSDEVLAVTVDLVGEFCVFSRYLKRGQNTDNRGSSLHVFNHSCSRRVLVQLFLNSCFSELCPKFWHAKYWERPDCL